MSTMSENSQQRACSCTWARDHHARRQALSSTPSHEERVMEYQSRPYEHHGLLKVPPSMVYFTPHPNIHTHPKQVDERLVQKTFIQHPLGHRMLYLGDTDPQSFADHHAKRQAQSSTPSHEERVMEYPSCPYEHHDVLKVPPSMVYFTPHPNIHTHPKQVDERLVQKMTFIQHPLGHRMLYLGDTDPQSFAAYFRVDPTKHSPACEQSQSSFIVPMMKSSQPKGA